MESQPTIGFGAWLRAHALVVFGIYVTCTIAFVLVAGQLDNRFAEAAWEEHKLTATKVLLSLIPGYALICLVHTLLSFGPARRLWRRCLKRRAKERVGFFRLLLSAFLWSLLIFVLSMGPMSYVGSGSLDALAREISPLLPPSIDIYVFKTWHLQELFTAICAFFAFLLLLDLFAYYRRVSAPWKRSTRIAVSLVIGATIGLPIGAAMIDDAEPLPERKGAPNILIIGSDSLRYDRLGCNGYERDCSPNIDRMAKDSISFDQLHVATASTLESLASFLCGLYPANHGLRYMFVRKDQVERFEEEVPSLPEILRDSPHRYRSAVVGDWAANSFTIADFGFDETLTAGVQNLDIFLAEVALRANPLLPHYFSNVLGERVVPQMRQVTSYMNPSSMTDTLIDRLDDSTRAGNPFFGMLFVSCTHLPFQASYPFNRKFTDRDYDGPNRYRLKFDVDDFIQHGFADDHSAEEKAQVNALYDGGVLQFDHEVGRVLDHLEATGLDENTIVIVFSDHGEDLYDPDVTLGHGTNFWGGDQSTRVPLLMRLPKGNRPEATKGMRVRGVTRNVDLAPTLLDMLRLPRESLTFDGRTLLPHFADPEVDSGHAAFAETCYLFYPKKVKGDEAYRMKPADQTLYIDRDFDNMFVLKPKYHDYVIDTKDRMMRTERWKLIYLKGKSGPIWRLYDMNADPTQRQDLSAQGGAVFELMKTHLMHWIETGEELPWPRSNDEL